MTPSKADSPRRSLRAGSEFSHAVRKTLATRVGWRCSNPDCRAPTTGPASDPRGASVVGVAAHITAASPGGPRFDQTLNRDERKSVSNGIWLCGLCAKTIDDDPSRYTALVLRFWRMDAERLADQEKGRPPTMTATIRFAAIGIDPSCMWQRSHRLARVALHVGAIPQIGFHAIPQQAWSSLGISPETRSCDPILDLTLVNDAPRLGVLSSIGFEAHAVWSDLKGLSQPYKILVADGYVLPCTAITVGEPQMLHLPNPVAIPAGQPLRIKLTLVGFRPNLAGNESLLRLLAIADVDTHRSRLINLGVY
jgi:hypothetical protein